MLTFDPDRVAVPSAAYVAGQFRPGRGDELPVRRPSDGRIVATLRECDAQDCDEAIRGAHEAWSRSGWARRPPRDRAAILRRLADLIEAQLDDLARLEALGSCRTITETRGRDIPVVAEMVRFAAECADKFTGEVLSSAGNALNLVEHEPWGVVLAISPWNVPLLLAMAKVAPALAAGNAVVLKPSEITPLSALRLAEMATEAGLPPGLFNVVVGRGATTGTACVRHPLVRYISFTGSTAAGITITAEAARHGLKPVSLELGGKGPQVVFADAPDLDAAAGLVASGIQRNAGQICFAGTRLVVEESIAETFVARVAEVLQSLRPGPTWDAATELPPIISTPQVERIESLVSQGVAAGGRVRLGGRRVDQGAAHFFEPTILADMAPDNPALVQEIFGPVLGVQTFRGFDEAMRLADHPHYGLTASVYTRDIDRAIHAAREIDAGTIWINGFGRGNDLTSPFGGFKQSGHGKDFGVHGFRKYQRAKNINVFLGDPRG